MLSVYHSLSHLFFFHFSLLSLCQLQRLSHMQQGPFPDLVICMDATSDCKAFYFQSSGLTFSFSGI